jgi:hypothetical protein
MVHGRYRRVYGSTISFGYRGGNRQDGGADLSDEVREKRAELLMMPNALASSPSGDRLEAKR